MLVLRAARVDVRYPWQMLTVVSWYQARRSRRPLHELVLNALTSTPTLFALVSDRYTTETNIRPFHFLAERLGERMHVLVAAEWPQDDREREGAVLLRQLGLAPEWQGRLLQDEGERRTAVVLRARQPVAVIDLFFEERGLPMDTSTPLSRGELSCRETEAHALSQLEQLLIRLPPQPPQPPPVAPAQPRPAPASRAAVAQPRVEEQRRDRFELIELD